MQQHQQRRVLAAPVSAGPATVAGLLAVGAVVLWEADLQQQASRAACFTSAASLKSCPQLARRHSARTTHSSAHPVRSKRQQLRPPGRWRLRLSASPHSAAAVAVPAVSSRTPDYAVSPQGNNPHRATLIYLHGFCGCGLDYLDEECTDRLPWRLGRDYAPGLRVLLPTAPRLRQPWGEELNAWYGYAGSRRNSVGNKDSLDATRRRLTELVHREVARLGGAARRVFIGGLSQGCTIALDLYFREAAKLGLGGFVGSVGFLPKDGFGFFGADEALEALAAHPEQAHRPVYLQCATDDREEVPWKLVKMSLQDVDKKLPGLTIRKVRGRGHQIDCWEAKFLNQFLRRHARDAYFTARRRHM